MMARSQPRAQRRAAFIKAQLRDGEAWRDITIGNISTTGLMVKCQKPPAIGSDVEVRRRGVAITGQVVWASPTRFGLRSAEPIDVSELTAESGLIVNHSRSEAPWQTGFWHWQRST